MRYVISRDLESEMNLYFRFIENDGFLGFCVAEFWGETCIIRGAYKTRYALPILSQNPEWRKLEQFTRENREQGMVLPWINSLSPEKTRNFKSLVEFTGNRESVVSMPRRDSIFVYLPEEDELCEVECRDVIEKPGDFSREFMKIYAETCQRLKSMEIERPKRYE